MDEVDQLLRDFLQLMSISEEWDVPKLKEKLEWNIVHKFDMIQRLPHLNDLSTFFFSVLCVGLCLIEFAPLVREEAEKYNAVNLMEALDEFAKHNSPALNRLQKN